MSSDGSNEFSRCPASHKCTRLYLHLFATFISNWVAERKSHVNPALQLLLAEHSERCVLWLRRKSPKLKKVRQWQWHQPAQQQSLKFIVTFFPKLTHKCRTFLQLVGIYIYIHVMEIIFCEFVNFQNSFLGWFIKLPTRKPACPSRAPKGPPVKSLGSGPWRRVPVTRQKTSKLCWGLMTIEMTSQIDQKDELFVWWTIL